MIQSDNDMPEQERDMSEVEPNADDVIQAYRRRKERMVPILLGGLAVVLLVVGLFLVVLWLTGDNPPASPAFLASDTPTPTSTNTPLPPTATATITNTLEPSETPTPEGPITYIVDEGDTLGGIADQFEVDLMLLMSVNGIKDANEITIGMELTIPEEGTELPTLTPLPETLIPGSKIEYVVQSGDSLQSIASQFNSTAEAIAEENDIEDLNNIYVGQALVIPVGVATATATASGG
ncbi:MAG: LysM peptidoglycan-binding domain-containing protein [Anaerolineales bacterium]|nr:LysM peptidoglycan-binding domain-containing protein [Anaerolineales bacterium]